MERRTFLSSIVAGLSFVGIRPSWSHEARQSPVLEGITPRLSDLADAWFETGLAYERAHRLYCLGDRDDVPSYVRLARQPGCPEGEALTRAQQALAHAGAAVLRERSQTAADVILKYHIIDMLNGHWPPENWEWVVVSGDALCDQVLREADRFGVRINPFWHATKSHSAAIDGNPHSPAWSTVSKWRLPHYTRST